MAKGRSRSRQRQLDKAVHPNITSMSQQQKGNGTQPTARPFALMEAINAATGQLHFDPLPRDPYNDSAFGPLVPLTPDPIDPVGQNGRSDPRTWQYPVGWNLPGNGNREVPWQVLRASADGVGVIRRCIEVRKKHVRDLKWTIGPTEEAIQAAYMANPGKGKQDAEQELQTKYAADIARLKAFWKKPWRSNGLSFGQWVNAVLEDYLVLDAVTVYPQMSYGGEVLDFRLVDSSTIKILLDSYGNRPQPPHPAFQQILYGFPRGEWAASAVQDTEGNLVVDNAFARSELFYYRENYRTSSPYGLSAVEQALIDSRLYLQRQKWMLAEYDDGSTPLTWLETAAAADGKALSLPQARQWEKAFNQKVAGNTGERLRVKVMPNGWKAVQMSTVDERYRPEYDLYLLKLLCSYFGVPITELGFTETQGLGSSGMHEAQADVSGRVGKRPDTAVLTDVINELNLEFLKMPPELEFSFADPVGANDMDSAQTDQLRQQGGVITVNDIRHSQGLALLPFQEANMPFILGGPQGIIFLEGAKTQIEQAAKQAQMATETQQMGTAGKLHLEGKKLEDGQQARSEQRDFAREQMQSGSDTQKAAVAELQAYRVWRRRNPDPKRAFTFKYVAPDDGWPELEGLGPNVVWYEGYEWLEGDELLKSAMSFLEWNARNPRRPRGPNGRFVKAGSLISALEKEGKRTAKDSPNIDAPSTVGHMTGHDPISVADYPDYGNGNGWHVYEGGEKRSTWPTRTQAHAEADRLRAGAGDIKPSTIVGNKETFSAFPAKDGSKSHTEQHVRDAYARVIRPGHEWLGLADLRTELGGERESQDKVLREMIHKPDVRIIPVANLKALKVRDRQAALHAGGEDLHAISIGPHNIQTGTGAPHVEYQMNDRQREIERMAIEDQLRFTKDGPNADVLRERLNALGGKDVPIETQLNQAFDRILARPHRGLGGFLSSQRPLTAPGEMEGDPWVHVDDVRQELSHLPQAEVDHALIQLSGGDVRALTAYWPTKQVHITAAERAGAPRIGDEPVLLFERHRALEPGDIPRPYVDPESKPSAYVPVHVRSLGDSVRTTLRGRTEEDARKALSGMRYSAKEWRTIAEDLKLAPGKNAAQTKEIVLASIMNKAAGSDADPKAQLPATQPAPPDTRWPGWLLDTMIATLALNGLMAAMSLVMTGPVISGLLSAWRKWSSSWKPEMGDPVGRAQAWLRRETELFDTVVQAIAPPIRQAHLEGGLVGQESARALMAYQEHGDIRHAGPAVQFELDWGNWVPGHPEAARLLLEPGGLERLLRESDITIKQIAVHRLDQIGKILGRGLAQGLDPEAIGRQLSSLATGDDGKYWAHMTAVTETNRALSAAAEAEYRAAGLKSKGWMTAFDQRVCKICDHNAFNLDRTPRVVPIDARFPSGDMHPPGHPHCRCAVIPILEWPSTMSDSFGPAEGVS